MIPQVFKPDFVFSDHRGTIRSYDNTELCLQFPKTNVTTSKKGVIRGFHVSDSLFKAFRVEYGHIFLAVVSCLDDDLFGSLWTYELTAENGLRVLVPPGYGVAHLVLSDPVAVVAYDWSDFFDGKAQRSYAWDAFGRDLWPIENPIVSERDRLGRFVD